MKPSAGEPRPPLLYLSPVAPAVGGNGLAMRAAAVLRLLARRHAVTLVVTPLYPPVHARVSRELAAFCERVAILPPPRTGLLRWLLARPSGRGRGEGAAGQLRVLPFAGERFDVIHVFRLSMLDLGRRYAEALEAHDPELHLDLDDIESEVLDGIAALHRAAGRVEAANAAAQAARRARMLEDDALRSFDRVYLCSAADRERLAGRGRAQLCVLPNTVERAPGNSRPQPDRAFEFLFVGTLGYSPNADAIAWFCTEVVPRIEGLTRCEFRVVIAGGGASAGLLRLQRPPTITFVGRVAELTPLYRQAGAAVVPIRAGGGTRIKALEAFSYACPVVATPVGIAGIEARHGEHVLIGETPEDFARCCVQLMEDAELRRRLAAAGMELVHRAYSTETAAAILDGLSPPRSRISAAQDFTPAGSVP